jgi:endonuclease YncB( thermonuclease family)
MHVLGRLAGVAALFAQTIILPTAAQATDSDRGFPGPVTAHVTHVVDGDTFEALAAIWLGQTITVRIRIAGIDAPELRARCESEYGRAVAARDYLIKRIEGGDVRLSAVRYDKYGGRVDADVADTRGNIGDGMIKAGLARAYYGERRDGWC